MNNNIIVKVTAEGKLEIPPELLVKLQPLTEYEVLIKENEIVFRKISQQLSWGKLSAKIESLGEDAEQPNLQEISVMVKATPKERNTYYEYLRETT